MQDVDGEFSDDGEVFRAKLLAVPGTIFVEDRIEHPMEAILDAQWVCAASARRCAVRRAEDR